MAAVAAVAARDERRHPPGPEPWWGESWYFDFATADASLGGFVRLGLYPNQGVAWYWAALVGQGRRLVLVRDHDLEAPAGRQLEIRGQGIWSAVNCETPLDHWSIGLEAFAVALDDPTEAYRGERGDLVGLGFDLEWEAQAPAFGPIGLAAPGPGAGYGQTCQVTGEILVGDEQLEFDGTGHRGHHWGVQDWWAGDRASASGIGAAGAFALSQSDGEGEFCGGWTTSDVVQPPPNVQPPRSDRPDRPGGRLTMTPGPDGLPASVSVTLGDRSLVGATWGQAPLLLAAPDGRRARLARCLCRYRAGAGDESVGWAEQLTVG